jgi:hypothetical protein
VTLKVMKGLTRTEGGGVRRLSSVLGKLWDGMANREMGRGLITTGRGGGSRVGFEGHSELGEGRHIGMEDNGDGVGTLAR